MNRTSSLADIPLPHLGSAKKLGGIVSWGDESVTTLVQMHEVDRNVAGNVCATIAIEYMAQTAGLLADGGKKGRGGMIASVRSFRSSVSHFEYGTELVVSAKKLSETHETLRCSCEIRMQATGALIAQANVMMVFEDGASNGDS